MKRVLIVEWSLRFDERCRHRSLIGYSVYDIGEECYEYNENACYIAATSERFSSLWKCASMVPGDARVEAVHWDDLLRDFGCSGGQYAMEADAFARFRTLAEEHTVSFDAEAYDGDDSLMVVEIERRFLTPDDDNPWR